MKTKILNYYNTVFYDYDEEEIKNAIKILNEYNEDLKDLQEIDSVLLVRIIDDDFLIKEIKKCIKTPQKKNPFKD